MTSFKGTLGEALVNTTLPSDYRIPRGSSARDLQKSLTRFAKENPGGFKEVVPKIKKLGDEFATYEGITVGLDDIEPEYSKRDPIIKRARGKIKRARTAGDITSALLEAQTSMKDISLSHPGDLAMQARSGSRGNTVQLMKTISSPVVVAGSSGEAVPYLIERGYSEGLSPAEQWIAGSESRAQVISGQLGTAIPGDLGKILASTMSNQVIASEDCGTTNGILVNAGSSATIGRYSASTGDPLSNSERVGKSGKHSLVRSPLTCEAPSGVCRKCDGYGVSGHPPPIGSNVGIRSAQALSEPLTQMQLSAKHGIGMVSGDVHKPRGVEAVRQFLEVPSSFFHKAVLSDTDGEIQSVSKAPQGGYDLKVSGSAHYVPPGRDVKVKRGDLVERGDVLSSGIPAPNEVVKYKGLGAGRNYMVSALEGVYSEAGNSVDRRHLERLAKSQLNYVRVIDKLPGYLPGEIIPFTQAVDAIRGTGEISDIRKAKGKTLTQPMLHHLPGTIINNAVLRDAEQAGIYKVESSDKAPSVEAHMAPASRTPLLNPNWMARLAHRYQKKTILDAATYGETANIHGHDPIPGVVFGKELRRGPGGTY